MIWLYCKVAVVAITTLIKHWLGYAVKTRRSIRDEIVIKCLQTLMREQPMLNYINDRPFNKFSLLQRLLKRRQRIETTHSIPIEKLFKSYGLFHHSVEYVPSLDEQLSKIYDYSSIYTIDNKGNNEMIYGEWLHFTQFDKCTKIVLYIHGGAFFFMSAVTHR